MFIQHFLPEKKLTNLNLENLFPDFSSKKIFDKVGINSRRISNKDEYAIDLAFNCAINLLNSNVIKRADIDFLIFCTQSPDYALPSGSAVLQDKLRLGKNIGAIDVNQGCSGYIYGLFLANSMIESGHCKNVLLITADTYTKYIIPSDKSNRSIFGDGASATIVNNKKNNFLDFLLGTDGSGRENLVAFNSCLKKTSDINTPELYMNGTEIFNFTLKNIPVLINAILNKNNLEIDDIDLFVFHQANKFMLNHLRKKIGIPIDKFIIDMEETGNTVSSSIPIVLSKNLDRFKNSKRVLLCGFGVGYSWGACVIENK